jgi:hypothetical protein
MPSSIRRIHSTYLGQKVFPKKMSEFEIREFFTLNVADNRAIRVDIPSKTRLALALKLGFVRMTGTTLDAYDYVPRPVLEFLGKQLKLAAPMLAKLRALYRRRMTRFGYQASACRYLGVTRWTPAVPQAGSLSRCDESLNTGWEFTRVSDDPNYL